MAVGTGSEFYRRVQIEGIVVIVGNFGSGKTEVAINLAIQRRRDQMQVRIADLDLVNPYFRTREVRGLLSALDIETVLPPDELLQADLPILSPRIAGMIRRAAPVTIVDVGGDKVGATVLSALADAFRGRSYQMLQVINPLRPETATVDGCLHMRRQIESASRLRVTGWVDNANLIDETGPDEIEQGIAFIQQLSADSGLPVRFITVPSILMAGIDLRRIDFPVLPIERQLVPPWKKATPVQKV